MPRRATLVLSGGGAKGAFQVGVEEILRTQGGFEWERVFGVSVGAVNGALIAQREFQRLTDVWRNLKVEQVYSKVGWLGIAWRLAMQKKTGLYDGTPLRRLIGAQVGGRTFATPFHVGRVSLTSGEYELIDHTAPGILDAIWHSATIPVIWEPVGPNAYVDGGLRNVSPLGDVLKHECTELVVVVNSPARLESAPRPPDILAALKRSLVDVAINEILEGDLREFLRINTLVAQALKNGFSLKSQNGTTYRHYPITIIRPPIPLGDPLDFSPKQIDKRIGVGREAARKWLAEGGESLTRG